MRRVTFSRNYTLSLSRTCRCFCKYCAFATHQAHLYAPEEVEERLDEALKRRAKELLVLTGEAPEVQPGRRRAARVLRARRLRLLRRLGLRAGARARAAAAHEPRRPLPRGLVAAARGDRVAGPDAGVGLRAADGDRPRRLADEAPDAAAGDDRSRGRAARSRSPAGSSSASARPRRSGSPRSRRSPPSTSATGTSRR